MIRIRKLAGIGVLALLSVSFSAQAEMKIGYVNTAILIQGSPQFEAVQKKLEAEFAPRQSELVALQKKLKQMEEDFSKNALLLSEDQRKKKERDILTTRLELKHSKEMAEEDLRIRQAEQLEKLREELLKAIRKHALAEGYDLIVSEGAVFYSEKIDVTQEILKLLKAGN